MSEEIEDLLLMQEYQLENGTMVHLIWRVPAPEFLTRVKKVQDDDGLSLNKAKIRVLAHMVKEDKADYFGATDQDAELFAANLREEGIFAGGSSGGIAWAALKVAQNLSADQTVVAVLADAGSRYLSKIFNDEWMKEKGYL